MMMILVDKNKILFEYIVRFAMVVFVHPKVKNWDEENDWNENVNWHSTHWRDLWTCAHHFCGQSAVRKRNEKTILVAYAIWPIRCHALTSSQMTFSVCRGVHKSNRISFDPGCPPPPYRQIWHRLRADTQTRLSWQINRKPKLTIRKLYLPVVETVHRNSTAAI